MKTKSTINDTKFGLLLDVDNSNIAQAYFADTSSGNAKNISDIVKLYFSDETPIKAYRSFLKEQFISWFKEKKGVKLSEQQYSEIINYVLQKKYPETQLPLSDFNGIKGQDLLDAFTFSRDQLINMKFSGEHNEVVGLNSKIKGVIAKVSSLDDCPDYCLQFAKRNGYPIILVGE